MPIIWRYLLSHYLSVLFFCVISFIVILLTTRLDEIAHFATLGPESTYIFLFTLHQIPYVLPIAIPISSLISSILLIQSLSRSHELTAMRAAGLSLWYLLAPMLFAAAFLTIANFYIVSELATNSHLSTNVLKKELRSINPLLLLHHKHLMKLKGIVVTTLGPSKLGEMASDVIIAAPDKKQGRTNLLFAANLESGSTDFMGRQVTLFKSMPDVNFDTMVVENMDEANISTQDFSQMMQQKAWILNNDHLKLAPLLEYLYEEQALLDAAKTDDRPLSEQKIIQRKIYRIYAEIIRRFSLAFAVFTFTLLGAAFGISISRTQSNRSFLYVIMLAAFYLMAYFTAQGIDHLIIAASLLYLVPHSVMIFLSMKTISRATKGIE